MKCWRGWPWFSKPAGLKASTIPCQRALLRESQEVTASADWLAALQAAVGGAGPPLSGMEMVALSAATVHAARQRAEPYEPGDDGDLVRQYLMQIGTTPLLTAEQEVDLAKRIEVGVYAAELLRRHDAGEVWLPVSKRRAELEAIARDGQHAKDQMIRANLRLVVSAAKKYGRSGLSLLDLVQDGNLGLIRAVEKFDYAKGYKFSTYAMWWIRQAIQRGIAEHARTVRLPAHVVEQLSTLARTERRLQVRLGREPTEEELATEARISPERVAELRHLARDVVSLDTPVGEDGETRVGDLIEDTEILQATDVVEYESLARELRALIDTLPPREATIISLRYGLHNGHPYSVQQIAQRLGVTGALVQQLERQALLKLRSPEHRDPLLDWAS